MALNLEAEKSARNWLQALGIFGMRAVVSMSRGESKHVILDELLADYGETRYSQGYKDAYLDALEVSAGKCEEMHDCSPTYIAEAIRSLPIPEAQK